MKITTLCLALSLLAMTSACGQNPKSNTQKDTARTEKMAQEAMAAYRAQKHRFEVKTCKLYYNEQQVVLDSLHLFEKVMGSDYVYNLGYYYSDKPVRFQAKVLDKDKNLELVYSIAVKLSNNSETERDLDMNFDIKKRDSMNYALPVLDGYLLIDGQLVNADTKIEDFNKKRAEKNLPLYSALLGMSRSQGITFFNTYCEPAYNAKSYTNVTLLYNEENLFENDYRTTTIWELRYNYSN